MFYKHVAMFYKLEYVYIFIYKREYVDDLQTILHIYFSQTRLMRCFTNESMRMFYKRDYVDVL